MNRINRISRRTIAVMAVLVVVAFAIPLGGCQTTQERVASDERRCQSYGAPGSPAYVQCRTTLDTTRMITTGR
jgi:hypothetical protein